jgi:hypothetical protein
MRNSGLRVFLAMVGLIGFTMVVLSAGPDPSSTQRLGALACVVLVAASAA